MKDEELGYEAASASEAAELIAAGCRVFDVRTATEYASHRISGAYLLPIQELNQRYLEIPRESESKVLIVCEHGVRSTHACHALSTNGWKNVVNLTGGMAAWMDAGLPVEREVSGGRSGRGS